jgi:hypothetical protein
MRWTAVVLTVVLLAACSGDEETEPATLQVDDVVIELSYHDCSESELGYRWAASNDTPRARITGSSTDQGGILMVDAELPDGSFASHIITDPRVTDDGGLVAHGTALDGSTRITATFPCRDRDPGGGSIGLGGTSGGITEASCTLGPVTPGLTAAGTLDGRAFTMSFLRQPALAGGFEDTVRLMWSDNFDELAASATFAADPPFIG